MKTLSREEFFIHMQAMSTQEPSLVTIIEHLEQKAFDEVEVIPPQKQGDGWTFQPIFLNQETEE